MKRSTYYIYNNQNEIVFCSKLKTEVRKYLAEMKRTRAQDIVSLVFNNQIVRVIQ